MSWNTKSMDVFIGHLQQIIKLVSDRMRTLEVLTKFLLGVGETEYP